MTTTTTGLGGLTSDDYYRLLKRLSPRGVLWRAILGTRYDKWLQAAAIELARIHNVLASVLADEMNPGTSRLIIDAWLTALGVPDGCVDVPTTTSGKQALAVARWLATNGNDPDFFIAVAANLGFTVTITETPYPPFRFGSSRFGDPMNGAEAQFYWRVNASASLTADERALLECEFNRLKPAHTIAEFVYS